MNIFPPIILSINDIRRYKNTTYLEYERLSKNKIAVYF